MANTRPYTEAHAIACVDVVIFFSPELDDLAGSELCAAVDAHLKSQKFVRKKAEKSPKKASKSAVKWQLIGSNDERLEEAHLHPRFIHVSAFEYRGWTISSNTAISRLEPVLRMCQSEAIRGVACGLAIVDVFINDSGSTYDSTEVFSKDSRLLSAAVHSGGHAWKQEMSWVEDQGVHIVLRAKAKMLSEEEDGAELEDHDEEAEDRSEHLTHIELRLTTPGNLDVSSDVEWSSEEFKRKLDRLHTVNKKIMLDILSDEMTQAIGLKE